MAIRRTINITVSGPVGCGKSAVIGTIENALMAAGVGVQFRNERAVQSEKNMTGSKWQKYLDMYQPLVAVEEKIIYPNDPHLTITVGRKWSERLAAAWSFTFGFRSLMRTR